MLKKLKTFTLSRLNSTPPNLREPPNPTQRSLTLSPRNIYSENPFKQENACKIDCDPADCYMNSNSEQLNVVVNIHTSRRDKKSHTLDYRRSRPTNGFRNRPDFETPPEIASDEDDHEIEFSRNPKFASSINRTKQDMNGSGPPLPPRKVRSATLPSNLSEASHNFQPPLPPRRKMNGISDQDFTNPLQLQPSLKLDEDKIMQNIRDLVRHGWYWGPLSKEEAEEKLSGATDGTFLVRDSSDDRHLLTISFRTSTKTFHTRIEFSRGKFSVFPNCSDDCYDSVGQLIDHAMNHCKNGVFFYSRRHEQPSITLHVCLLKPLSRFLQLRSLQHHCRFVIRQYTRLDLIQKLPLPSRIQDYVCMSIF